MNEAPARIAFRFHARDLNLVMGPPAQGHPIRFRVTLDGAPPGADHGYDVDADGWGSLRDARMYQLVRQAGVVADRTFEIEFLDPGARRPIPVHARMDVDALRRGPLPFSRGWPGGGRALTGAADTDAIMQFAERMCCFPATRSFPRRPHPAWRGC